MDLSLPELQFYTKKIHRLEMNQIVLEDENHRLLSKLTACEDYQLKYEMLLSKVNQENVLRRSREIDGAQVSENTIEENNHKWETKLAEIENIFQDKIMLLENTNRTLQKQLESFEQRRKAEAKLSYDSNYQLLQHKLDNSQRDNKKMKCQLIKVHQEYDAKLNDLQQRSEQTLREKQQSDKDFYRGQIEELRQQKQQVEQQLADAKSKIDPSRQLKIKKLQQAEIIMRKQNAEELDRLALLLQSKVQEIKRVCEDRRREQERASQSKKEQAEEITRLETVIRENMQNHQTDMLVAKSEMARLKQQEADFLKEEIRKLADEFAKERSQWTQILQNAEKDSAKVAQSWEDDKRKFIEEKNTLKAKIEQLRCRLKQGENKEPGTQDLIRELKDLDSKEDHFTSYENSITFMDRQVKRAGLKIEQKNRQISNLISEMNNLRAETEEQISTIRAKSKTEIKKLNDKILGLEAGLETLRQQLRAREKDISSKQQQLREQKEGFDEDSKALKSIIDEMQRDYTRLTEHKKTVEGSYREERDNVVTGKVDINQQRKKKWVELQRQRQQLEIIFREREKQVLLKQQMAEEKLRNQRDLLVKENLRLEGVVQELMQKIKELAPNEPTAENKLVAFQQKIATLDLEIALTQNLFDSLRSAKANIPRNITTQFDEIEEGKSEQVSSLEQSFSELKQQEICLSPQFKNMSKQQIFQDNFPLMSFHPESYKK